VEFAHIGDDHPNDYLAPRLAGLQIYYPDRRSNVVDKELDIKLQIYSREPNKKPFRKVFLSPNKPFRKG
jgi:hypothetical protein